MEPNVNYTVVGAFTIALIAAIVLTIIWLSAGFTSEEYTPYLIYMNESVNGLSQDATVKYNGVDVGTIKSIELNPNNPQQVKLLVDIKVGTPITEDTVAMLDTQGITGLAYIDLKNMGPSKKPLPFLPNEEYPVIPTRPSIFVRIDTALSQLSTNMNLISQQVQILLSPENQRAFKHTLENLDQITQNTAKSTQQLPQVMQTFNTQTLPATNEILQNVETITNNLTNLSRSLKQNPSVIIRGKTPQPLGPGEK